MDISVQDINETRKSVQVTVPAATIAQEEKALVGQFSQQARLPGFRPGKAPQNLITKKYKKEISEELNRKLMSKAYEQITESSDIAVYSVVEVDEGEFKSGEASEVTFTVDVRPEFTLPKYDELNVSVPSDEITDDEVAQAKQQLLEQRAEYNVVEREAEKGDYVKLSYEGKIGDDLVAELVPDHPTYGKQATTWEEAGSEHSPGVRAIIDGIVGMKAGDTKDVEESFDKDFAVEALREKTVTYSIEVQEVRQKVLPEITEELLKSMEVESEEKLVERLRDDVATQKKQNVEEAKRRQILDYLEGQVEFPVPESAVEGERENLLRDYMSRAMQQGASQDDFEANKDELFKGASEAAGKRVKLQFILSEIAKKEEISIENEDMHPRIMQEAMATRTAPEKLVKELQKDPARVQNLQREVLFNKTLAKLVDKASVTIVEEPEHGHAH